VKKSVPRGIWKHNANQTGRLVKKNAILNCRSLLGAAAGLLILSLVAGGSTPVLAQASDAADKCTPDVMRLCNEFIPDADRIVVCLKKKRRQLSPGCSTALSGGGATKAKAKSKRHRTRHKES
jgi:hypothetical protein